MRIQREIPGRAYAESTYTGGVMALEEFEVEGMSCQHCIARVRSALESLEGVEIVALDIGRASLEIGDDRSRDDVLSAIRSAGYSAE